MSVLSLRLPKSIYNKAKEIAQEKGVSMNQFVTLAIAEKLATLNAIDYLEIRAQRGSREKLLAVLERAPDVEPDEYDKL